MKKNKNVNENVFDKEFIVFVTKCEPYIYHDRLTSWGEPHYDIDYSNENYYYFMNEKELMDFIKNNGISCIKHVARNIKCEIDNNIYIIRGKGGYN